MKRILTIILSTMLLLSLSACDRTGTDKGKDSNSANSLPGATSAQSVNSGTPFDNENRAFMEAYRDITASPANVQGVITKITGNEITIKLIEPIEQIMRFGGDRGPYEGFDTENTPDGFQGRPPDGLAPENRPEGFQSRRPDGEAPPGEMRRDNRNFSFDQEINVTYTGESLSVAVPVSLSIMLGRDPIEVTSLSPNQVISFWYGDDKQTVIFAMVHGKAAVE